MKIFLVDPDMASMIDEEESSLSTRGVINPTAEERRKKDRLEDYLSDTESEYEPSLVDPNEREFPEVPEDITHTHDNDESDSGAG